jgi:aryl-alcohol dehydrogenase-like predicted oxidoreductase
MRPLDDRSLAIARGVGAVAAELGRPAAQVALNWLRAKKGVVPLLGARTDAQLQDNLSCLEFTLDAPTVAKLDELSGVALGFPHDYLSRTKAIASAGFDRVLDA